MTTTSPEATQEVRSGPLSKSGTRTGPPTGPVRRTATGPLPDRTAEGQKHSRIEDASPTLLDADGEGAHYVRREFDTASEVNDRIASRVGAALEVRAGNKKTRAEHQRRRDYGLTRRHATKLARVQKEG